MSEIYPPNRVETITRFYTTGAHWDCPRYDVQVDPTGISMNKQPSAQPEFLFSWDQLYEAMKEYTAMHPEVKA